jgi:hypothetical protein
VPLGPRLCTLSLACRCWPPLTTDKAHNHHHHRTLAFSLPEDFACCLPSVLCMLLLTCRSVLYVYVCELHNRTTSSRHHFT